MFPFLYEPKKKKEEFVQEQLQLELPLYDIPKKNIVKENVDQVNEDGIVIIQM